MIQISVIFVNYRTKDLTINAINSVLEKTEGIEYEIFVVDNNSQDGSIEAIEKEFPNINIIKNPINAGFGSANNLAIKQAQGKYIFCLNTDTLLLNNAIKIMFDFMEKDENKKVGVCGGYLSSINGNATICCGNLPSLSDLFWKLGLRYIFKNYYRKHFCTGLFSDEINDLQNVGYISGANLFIRKSVLDEVGLFDEQIFMYYEETDLCKRIWDADYKIKFVKDAKIQHLEGKSTKNLLQKKKWFIESEIYYYKKHYPHKVWLVKLIYIILYLLNWIILRNKDSKEILIFFLGGKS